MMVKSGGYPSVLKEKLIAAMPNVGLDVNVQDQTTPALVAYFSLLENETTLAAPTVIGERTFTVTSATGYTIGKYISIFSPATNRFFLATVLSAVSTVITIDTPLDFAFSIGDFTTAGSKEMAVNGNVTPVIFGVRNTEEVVGTAFDITRLIFSMLTDSAPNLSLFGDLATVVKGIVIRKVNGDYQNIYNAKTNRDLKNVMYDLELQSALNPAQGQNGLTGRWTFGGQSKMGVVIRLEPGEDLQVIIQDDLLLLTSFSVIAEGHAVE